jgi:hypothetical protein
VASDERRMHFNTEGAEESKKRKSRRVKEFSLYAFGYDAVWKDVKDVDEVKNRKRTTADWGERWLREKLRF